MNIVNTGFLKIMVNTMAEQNFCERHWLIAAGLPAEWLRETKSAKYISLNDFIKLGNQLPKHIDGIPTGLVLGRQSMPGSYGSIGFAASACATLAEAARYLPKFESLVYSNSKTDIKEFPKPRLSWTLTNFDVPAWLEDWILSTWVTLARWLVKDDISPSLVEFSYLKPKNVGAYESFFKSPINFDSDKCSISIETHLWESPLLQHQPHLKIPLQQTMKREMEELGQSDKNKVIHWVSDCIRSGHTKNLTLKALCQYMQSSERSLRRLLAEHETTFTEIVLDQKMQFASNELNDLDQAVSQVAHKTGYSDVVAFRRAFKRRFDCSPSEYRANRLIDCN